MNSHQRRKKRRHCGRDKLATGQFKPLPYQESMVGTLENVQILSIKAWARKYYYNI